MTSAWVYQSNRFFTNEEAVLIQEKLTDFAAGWKVHGEPLSAQAVVKDNLFIVLSVDEQLAAASGCSIDSSVRFLKSLEEEFNIQLFDRMNVAYKKNDQLLLATRDEFEDLVKTGAIEATTFVFDNTITSLDALRDKWEIPFAESWHKRVFG
ncbi:ABC transporter ATPase [Sphingobacterium sp. SRCM116780]|uniref:ABC transporter ATPase n=1 Tax=Sphingobacterium sp. SRCM116780 TaxID=2907623 RepID=UPI001F1AC2D3|nr:ABC transporter ATPase [Sphingobacterium sp. SRCM116780]UIR55238.1 ABC transporter ATPase [Sphingobacterium sp. SRCM116780]